MSRFSVVIPTYNRAKFLPHTLKSVFEQSHTAHEVIVIDDGSTDNTGEVLAKLADEHEALKVFRQENAERGAARNRGIEAATGDYIVLFDSDDLMTPGYLENLNDFSSSNPYADIIAGRIRISKNGKIVLHRSQKSLSGRIDLEVLLEGNPFACHFTLRRSETFIPFSEDRNIATAEDWLFLIENMLAGRIFMLVDQGSIIMNSHEGQSMKSQRQPIEARKKATQILNQSKELTEHQKKKMEAYTKQFSAIHLCDEGSYGAALSSCFKAMIGGAYDKTTLYTGFRILRGVLGG